MRITPTPPLATQVLAVVLLAAVMTAGGVVWLTAAGNLAATGTRIARLEGEREDLVERRAKALAGYSSATDPATIEDRAVALGFGPAEVVEYVTVVGLNQLPPTFEIPTDSPLGLLMASERAPADNTPTQPDAPGVVGRALGAITQPVVARPSDSLVARIEDR